MASQGSKIHLRSITIIGAGAAVLAVIGYLLLKSDSRKKSKKKVNKTTTTESSLLNNEHSTTETVIAQKKEELGTSMSLKEVNETEEINKLCDLYSKTSYNLSKSPPPSETIITKSCMNSNNNYTSNNKTLLNNDEMILFNKKEISSLISQPALDQLINNEQNINENATSSNISQDYCVECIINQNTERQNLLNRNLDEYNHQNFDLDNNNLMPSVEQDPVITTANEPIRRMVEINNDKLSETSSDSGNGTSEIHIVHSPHDVEYDDEENENKFMKNKQNKIDLDINNSINNNYENQNNNNNNENNNNCSENNKIDYNNNDANDKDISINFEDTKNEINEIESRKAIPQSISSMSITSLTQPETDVIVYEFHFPRKYCGKLIGRNGVHVDYIRNKTRVQIAVRNDPNVEDLQIVCLTGCIRDVDQALDIISARFPYRHYPQISFKPITKPIVYRRNRVENNKVIVSSSMYVQLTNQSTDVNVSAIVTPTHLFIQLPSHPTYQYLQRLDEDMLHLYSANDKNIPNLTSPVDIGTICAAPTSYGWHRAMVTECNMKKENPNYPFYNEDIEIATVKFLDYGGYLNIPVNQLKQLRTDFMSLPFQAIEVYLDGVVLNEDCEEYGKNLLSKLIKNNPLKAVVNGYSEENIPLIKLFAVNNPQKSFLINNELIAHGFAQKIIN